MQFVVGANYNPERYFGKLSISTWGNIHTHTRNTTANGWVAPKNFTNLTKERSIEKASKRDEVCYFEAFKYCCDATN